jgi:hypothetical protein
MDDIQQFDLFYATFNPKRTDDLKPGAASFIGWRGIWEALWIIEDGPYEGQWAIGINDVSHQLKKQPPFIWVPGCDLEIHNRVDRLFD